VTTEVKATQSEDIFSDGREIASVMRSINWSDTAIGSIEHWPQSLRTAVSICLASRFPMMILWGAELVQIYNDGYATILGTQQPTAMGQPARECSAQEWQIHAPIYEAVFSSAQVTYLENQQFLIERTGYLQESYFTLCYSPIRDESGGVGGILITFLETTGSVIDQRRSQTLHELASHSAEARSAGEACNLAARSLAGNPADIPFALFYLLDTQGTSARLVATAGLEAGTPASPRFVNFAESSETWPLAAVARTVHSQQVDNLEAQFGSLPGGIWPESPRTALILPIASPASEHPAGLLVAGISPRLSPDSSYRRFLELVAGEVATAVSSGLHWEENRKLSELALPARTESAHNQIVHILESLSDAFIALDNQWRIAYVNKEVVKLTDKQPADLIGKTLWEVCSWSTGTFVEQQYRRAVADQVAVHFEFFCEPKDQWLEIHAYPSAEGLGICYRDITERKLTEEVLRTTDERFRLLAESIPQIVWMAHPNGKAEYFNQCWFEYTGLEPGQGWASELVLHPEDLPRCLEVWKAAWKAGESYTIEYRLRRASDGTYRWHLGRALPQRDSEGRIIKWYGTITDIDDQKQAEKSFRFLTELDERMRRLSDPEEIISTVVNAVGEFLQVARCTYGEWDTENNIVCVYSDYCQGVSSIAGTYPLQEFGADIIEDLKAERTIVNRDVKTDPRTAGTLYQAICESVGVRAYVFVPLVKDEQCVCHLAVQTSGAPRMWTSEEVSVLQKVTERIWLMVENARLNRATTEALRRSQQHADQLHGLTEAALAINSALSIEQVLQKITQQARSIIGAHQSVTSMSVNQNWAQSINTVSLSDKYAAWRDYDAVTDGSGIYTCVCHQNRPMRLTQAELEAHPKWRGFGKEAQNHPPMRGWLAAPLVGSDGRNIGLIQLSDKYEGEFTEEDEAIIVQLAQMASVAVENTRLYEAEQCARTQAEAANRIKDEFLAVLSHELRSPLNPILGWSKLLRSRNLPPAKVAYAIETIERNALLQSQLIEDLLDVSRILRGKLSLNIYPVDLASVIEAALETVRLAAEAKSIEIKTVFDANVGKVSGDPNRLQQVIWNLLSNAVKFTPAGGRVQVQLQSAGTYAQIQVSDTGQGINPEFLPFVFDYFRQEDSTTTRSFGGLGLGLAIVRHLVELHGGTVQATSFGENQGATFTIQVPLMRVEPAIPEADVLPPDALNLAGIRILVVEDDADSRSLLVFLLEEYGASVQAVSSAFEALEVISQKGEFANAQEQPDILVSDIGMAHMDGYMLIREIRAMPADQGGQIPAIALTAYAGETDQQQILEAGFQKHITKPVEPAFLAGEIAQLLASRTQNNQPSAGANPNWEV
jgi:PAS domain S-box-containing protein